MNSNIKVQGEYSVPSKDVIDDIYHQAKLLEIPIVKKFKIFSFMNEEFVPRGKGGSNVALPSLSATLSFIRNSNHELPWGGNEFSIYHKRVNNIREKFKPIKTTFVDRITSEPLTLIQQVENETSDDFVDFVCDKKFIEQMELLDNLIISIIKKIKKRKREEDDEIEERFLFGNK